MLLLAIIFIVCFIVWLVGGFFVYSPAGERFRSPHSVLLAIMLGILGWIVLASAVR